MHPGLSKKITKKMRRRPDFLWSKMRRWQDLSNKMRRRPELFPHGHQGRSKRKGGGMGGIFRAGVYLHITIWKINFRKPRPNSPPTPRLDRPWWRAAASAPRRRAQNSLNSTSKADFEMSFEEICTAKNRFSTSKNSLATDVKCPISNRTLKSNLIWVWTSWDVRFWKKWGKMVFQGIKSIGPLVRLPWRAALLLAARLSLD